MIRAGLEHVDLIVLQDDLRLNHLETLGTEAIGEVVINIRAIIPLHQWVICSRNCRAFYRYYGFFLAIFAVAHALISFLNTMRDVEGPEELYTQYQLQQD